jgi:hypothetical protein
MRWKNIIDGFQEQHIRSLAALTSPLTALILVSVENEAKEMYMQFNMMGKCSCAIGV